MNLSKKGVRVLLEKNPVAFKNVAEARKKVFDNAVEFYSSNSFQWKKYPETDDLNTISKTKSAIYTFFVKNPKKYVDEILTAVNNIKTNRENNKLPQINTDSKESFKENGCLYVGSVTCVTLEKRIKQHWRKNDKDVSNGTYALKLCDWISDVGIKKEYITVYFCDMIGQNAEIIRTIEDCLATVYSPLLGKRDDGSSPYHK